MSIVRFGIIGCGGISTIHAESLKKLESQGIAILVAGVEPDPDHAAKFEAKWKVPVFSSIQELLSGVEVDAVSVCSPSGLHCDLAIEAMKAGKHALVEKPMDLLVSKVDEAIRAAREHNVNLGGVFQQRFPAGPQKVKRAIDQGYFGQIIFVHCETPWFRSQEYYDHDSWRGTWKLDCGVLSNQAPHMIDRLIWLGGDIEEVISATCDTGKNRTIEAETNAVATVRLVNGALGTITGSTLVFGGLPQRVIIAGTEGSASFVGDDLEKFQTSRPFEAESESVKAEAVDLSTNPLAIFGDHHCENIKDFALAITEGRAPKVTGEDGRRVVRALNLIYEKAGVGPYKPA